MMPIQQHQQQTSLMLCIPESVIDYLFTQFLSSRERGTLKCVCKTFHHLLEPPIYIHGHKSQQLQLPPPPQLTTVKHFYETNNFTPKLANLASNKNLTLYSNTTTKALASIEVLSAKAARRNWIWAVNSNTILLHDKVFSYLMNGGSKQGGVQAFESMLQESFWVLKVTPVVDGGEKQLLPRLVIYEENGDELRCYKPVEKFKEYIVSGVIVSVLDKMYIEGLAEAF